MELLGLLVLLEIFVAWAASTTKNNLCGALHSLGLESGLIKDDQATASSFFNTHTMPHFARLNTNVLGGAWCPKTAVATEGREYLEVDLGADYVIGAVQTQGRVGARGHGLEFTPYYKLQYQRSVPTTDDSEMTWSSRWRNWSWRNGSEIVHGNNEDTRAIVTRVLDPPIVSSVIRLIPYSKHRRHICLRLELLGCRWDGPVSYSTNDGNTRGDDVSFRDAIYDGERKHNQLQGGLGLLVDGKTGSQGFDRHSSIQTHSGWLGWKIVKGSQTITFDFNSARRFISVKLFASTAFSKATRPLESVKVAFSVGRQFYQPQPVYFLCNESTGLPQVVRIPLHGRQASRVAITFISLARWLLLSEVRFEIEPVAKEDLLPVEKQTFHTERTLGMSARPTILPQSQSHTTSGRSNYRQDEPLKNLATKRIPSRHLLAGLAGCLGALLLVFLAALFLVFCVRMRKRKSANRSLKQPLFDLSPLSAGARHIPLAPLIAESDVESECKLLPSTGNSDTNSFNEEKSSGSPCQGSVCSSVFDPRLSGQFSINDIKSRIRPLPEIPNNGLKRPLLQESQLFYATSDVIYSEPQEPSNSLHINLKNEALLLNNLNYVRKLGEGLFGELHVMREKNGDQCYLLKTCYTDAADNVKEEFRREAESLQKLDHPHVARLVLTETGATRTGCMLLEYTAAGDLWHVLQRCSLGADGAERLHCGAVSAAWLLNLATQLASAMQYLQSCNMVHRDLAARNCLLGTGSTLKLSDCAQWRPEFRSDYCVVKSGAALPIRWLAPESIVMGQYTSRSDVWSFGVTLWELLTLCRETPRATLTDAELLMEAASKAETSCQEQSLEDGLPTPPCGSKDVWTLIKECRSAQPSQRPDFREIYMFLKRKSINYLPPTSEIHA